MKKVTTLALVNSSFQLICAIEFLLKNNTLNSAVFVSEIPIDSAAYKQMKNLLDDFNLKGILTVPICYSGTLEERIGSYGQFFKENLARKKFDTVLFGDIRKQWMQDFVCSLDSNQTIMIDDGGAVLPVINFMLEPAKGYLPIALQNGGTEERKKLATKIKSNFGLDIQRKKVFLFSVFHKETYVDCEENNFQYIIKFYNPENRFIKTNEVHFIGAPFLEYKLLDLSEYMQSIERFDAMVEDKLKRVYYKHRYETNEQKLFEIEKLGYEIRTSEINYEQHLIQSGSLPTKVASILSTSLFNIKSIFPERVDAYFFPLNENIIRRHASTQWMVEYYNLAQHWQQIFARLPAYGVSEVI